VFETPNLSAAYWDGRIKTFTDAYPQIQVTKITAPATQAGDYAKQLLATGQLPDVMMNVNVTDFLPTKSILSFTATELAPFADPMAGAIGGVQYITPEVGQIIDEIHYNKTMFDAAGIAAPPTTWAEFLQDCKKLKDKGFTPIELGGGADTWTAMIFMQTIWTNDLLRKDPQWLSKRRSGTVHFADPDFTAATAKFKTLIDDGYVNADAASVNYAGIEKAFLDGKAAMYPMGNWFIPAYAKAKPAWQLGQFLLPGDSGPGVVPFATGGGAVVSSATKFPDQAKLFAVFFTSNKSILERLAVADGQIPNVPNFTMPPDAAPQLADAMKLIADATASNRSVAYWAGDPNSPAGMDYTKIPQQLIAKGDLTQAIVALDKQFDTLVAAGK
jgi:multiple sugar transport system substrate-binding protein